MVDAVPAPDDLTETTVIEAERRTAFGRTPKIALVDVRGMISDSAPSRGLISRGENPVSRLVESLNRAARDRDVRAIVIRVNSPGGTVTASDMMYREIMHFRERTQKPVVVLMGEVAASGGFYIACAGDEIMAHPTTITGSVGVIIQLMNFSEGMQRIGIRAETITSGDHKSMGSPFEPMPEDHRVVFQGMVDDFFGRFQVLVQSRFPSMTTEHLAEVSDGRVITGARAEEIGLVDGTGDLRDAVAVAQARAGITTARVVKYHRSLEYVGSPFAEAPMPSVNLVQVNLPADVSNRVGFYYLWDPAAW